MPSALRSAELGAVPRSRLETLSAAQLDELVCLLDDQWHALVRMDNLLGPVMPSAECVISSA